MAKHTELSLRAVKLLRRLHNGHFYRADCSEPSPAMQELIDAGLVGTMGRVARIVRCYVPKGTKPLKLESFPEVPEKWAL